VPDWLQIFVLYRYQLKKYQGKLPVKRGLNDMTSLTALLDLRMSELDGVGAIKKSGSSTITRKSSCLPGLMGMRTSIAPSKQAPKHTC
jgi:hypothetical protein